ncbi:hypothetical protein WKI45_27455 [Delftia tsuruhatensis]
MSAMQMRLGDLDGCYLVIDPNTSARDSLEQASCYLATAKDLLYGIAADSTDAKLWGVFQLLEIGKSMLDATVTNPALALKTEV